MITMSKPITNLSAGDGLTLFPTYGHRHKDGRTWKANFCGVVIETENVRAYKRLMVRVLKRFIKADPAEFETDIFRERIKAFAAETIKGRRIAIRIGSQIHRLQKKSKGTGHFRGSVRLTLDEVDRLKADGVITEDRLNFEVIRSSDDHPEIVGQCHLLEPQGVSVVSDIDDTIKVTQVVNRKALLDNTFLRRFEPIDGMAELYRHWRGHGAVFHYVSSSPWQLFEPLSNLCRQEGFPDGTMHLMNFRFRDQLLRKLLLIRRRRKAGTIKALLRVFPRRSFILVGDSGEGDPEMYGDFARRYRDRVDAILIRQLPERPLEGERQQKAFRKLKIPCRTFERAEEITDFLTKVSR